MAAGPHTGYRNPYVRDGKIRFPDNASLVRTVERWASLRGAKTAYRFLDFASQRDGEVKELSWAAFGARNRAVGARLQQVTQPGDRVAILCGQNLDYLVSFFGILYSGRIAVPLFDPGEPGHVGRLHAVVDDCTPAAVLTTSDAAEGVNKFFRSRPAGARPRVIAVDAVPPEVGATWELPAVDPNSVAYLQYTSGSTRTPTGVQITHLNLPTNVIQVLHAMEGREGDRGVTWLPFFHDMGLITILLSSLLGQQFTFMTPAAFVRRPHRWIREMARREGETGDCYSAAPNFAFEHAALRGLPKEDDPPLDLSNVKAILNGSEPISATSVRKFMAAFEPYGIRPNVIKPSYGLAEATLFVSTTALDEGPKILYVDRAALGDDKKFVVVDADANNAVAQASAGVTGVGQWGVVVDPATGAELPDGHIGEIWLHGQNMGAGYWNRPEESDTTFKNVLASRIENSHAEGTRKDGFWVSTGDYGTYYDDHLYITGRIKDLVIIDGRNHYPQDLENSAELASKALRTGYVAAFSVPANQLPKTVFDDPHTGLSYDPDDSSEQLVIVAERAVGAGKLEPGPIVDDVRAAIAVRHGVMVRDVLLVRAGTVPRTSSGKIGRSACRAAYLDESLRSGTVGPNAFPEQAE